jgi:hypothetical protein
LILTPIEKPMSGWKGVSAAFCSRRIAGECVGRQEQNPFLLKKQRGSRYPNAGRLAALLE